MPKCSYAQPFDGLSGTLTNPYGHAGLVCQYSTKIGNLCRRWLSTPNPRSTLQNLIRTQQRAISETWNLLSPDFRAAWRVFGLSQERVDKLGNLYTLTGFQAFSMINGYSRLAIGSSPFAPTPTWPTLTFQPTLGNPPGANFCTADISDKTLTLKATFPDATNFDGRMFCLFSRTPLVNGNARRADCRLFDTTTANHFTDVLLVPGVNITTFTFTTAPFSTPGGQYFGLVTVLLSHAYEPAPILFSPRIYVNVAA
jgi:hypothetical protein